MIFVYILFALFVLLQVADVASTVALLARGGSEANRLIVKLGAMLGSVRAALVLVKIVAVVTLGVFVFLFGGRDVVISTIVLAIFCVFYLWVVAHNLAVWRGLKS